MGLRINQNISSLRVQANLAKVSSRLEQSLERLSSGLRINRAADDAAGLAISEKLRSQVRGLGRARLNAQDGISLLQVAEGALNETHSNLQRMRELALQASNDTLTSSDRLELQKEIVQLRDDVDRIANNTEFNTKRLLDGSQSAIVSSSANGTGATVTGVTEDLGDYTVSLFQKSAGTKQVQSSNIFTLNGGTSIAVSTTKLEDVAQFYDSNSQFILADGQTLTLLANSKEVTINITKDLTLGELATRIETAEKGTLGMTQGISAFQSSGSDKGTIQVQSGLVGEAGEVTFAAQENLLVALGFGTKQAAVDGVISVKAVNVATGVVTTGATTNQTLGNVVQGVDLVIGSPTSANATSSIRAVDGISISTLVSFRIFDNVGAVSNTGLNAGTSIRVSQGRYTLTDLVSRINTALTTLANRIGAVGRLASVKASINSSNQIIFTHAGSKSALSGTGAAISIIHGGAASAAARVLGLQNTAFTGSGGVAASFTSSTTINVGNGFNFDYSGVNSASFAIRDGHSNSITQVTVNGNHLALTSSAALDAIVVSINTQLVAGSVKIESYNNSGKLGFRTTETGDGASIRVNILGGDEGKLGFAAALNTNKGTGGVDPVSANTLTSTFIRKGFALQRDAIVGTKLQFSISNGTTGAQIAPASPVLDTIVFAGDLVSLINNNATVGAFAESKFNTITNRLEISSKTLGSAGKLKITDNPGPGDANTIGSVFGFASGNTIENGTGAQSFNLHIVSKRSKLTVGANNGQTIELGIRNVSGSALGIDGIDVTNSSNAARALRRIDRAIDTVSSSRATLGAIENRLSVAISNLDNAATNLSAAESRIRDLDIASQIVDFTRDQILTQAGTAILAQANTQPQSVLQLLG